MRVFDTYNKTMGDVCPICGTNDEGKVVLVGIDGTQEGNNIEARQYHVSCISLTEMPYKDARLLSMLFEPKGAE